MDDLSRRSRLSVFTASVFTLAAHGAYAQQAGTQTLEEVVVSGVRAAQEAAIEIKREAPQIVDSISAEDFGKLPDVTLSDSLQRVPGVQIRRSAGEGSQLNIRGMPQVLVTMNGEQYLSAGGGDEFGQPNIGRAQPDFVDIPPTLFSGVDVVKSQTAANLDGGISGAISLKTRRPFDLQNGWTTAGTAEMSYGSEVEKFNGLYSALVGYNTDTWGGLLTLSYSKADLQNKNPRVYSNGAQRATEQDVGFDFNGDGVIGNNMDADNAPRDYFYNWVATELENRSTERERIGTNVSFQNRFSDTLTLTVDGSLTHLENTDRSVAAQLHTNWGTTQLQPGSIVDPNGVLEYGVFRYPRFQTHSVAAPSEARALNTNMQLNFDGGGKWAGDLRWVHGDANRQYDESRVDGGVTQGSLIPRGSPDNQTFFNPNGVPFVDATIDFRGGHPVLGFNTDVTQPANWQINSTWAQGNEIDAGLDTLAANGRYELKWRAFSALHFGLRHGERSFDYDAYKYLAPITPAGMCERETQRLYYFKDSGIVDFCTAAAGADQYSVLQPISFAAVPQYVGTFNNFDPVVINGIGNGLPAIDPRAMDDPVAFQNALYPGNERYLQPADSYGVKETSESAYVMANFEGSTGTNGIPFAGNIGLRVVDTDIDITSFQTTATQFLGNPAEWNGVNAPIGEDQINNSYRDWLPSANISFDIAEDMKMRYAYARTVARQDLPDLGRGLVVFYRANEGDNPSLPPTAQLFLSGRAGNPNLEPWRSDNFNAAYEWYFRDASLFSATVFLMQVESFLTSITTNEPQPDADGVVREGGPVTRVANGDGGSIHGFELGYQQTFDFLPGVFGGLGTALNYTYSDAQTGGEDIEGNGLPIGDNSKHQVNAVLWYQQRGLQARVAYNWRSKRYSSTNDPSGVDPLAIWNRSVGYLDASTSYDITPNFTVYLQGVNLTGENEARYAQWENQFYDQSIFERRYFFGVRFRN